MLIRDPIPFMAQEIQLCSFQGACISIACFKKLLVSKGITGKDFITSVPSEQQTRDRLCFLYEVVLINIPPRFFYDVYHHRKVTKRIFYVNLVQICILLFCNLFGFKGFVLFIKAYVNALQL